MKLVRTLIFNHTNDYNNEQLQHQLNEIIKEQTDYDLIDIKLSQQANSDLHGSARLICVLIFEVLKS